MTFLVAAENDSNNTGNLGPANLDKCTIKTIPLLGTSECPAHVHLLLLLCLAKPYINAHNATTIAFSNRHTSDGRTELHLPPDKEPSDQPIWIDAEDTAKSLSPRQLLQWVKRLGVGLDRLGLQQDDAVLMYSSNHIFVPVAYLGVAGSGRIFTGCNPAYGIDETVYQLSNTGAKMLLVEPQYLDIVLQAASKSKFPRERIYLFDDKPSKAQNGVKCWTTMLGSESESKNWQWHRMSPEESKTRIAVLNYSSGTTGLPKGVMISHQNVIANVEQSLYMRRLEQPSGEAPPERWLGFLPLYHAYGQLWSIVAAAKNTTPCYYMRAFNFPKWLSHIQTHGITHIKLRLRSSSC